MVIQRGEFLTAYTPYQPEIAQGTLQVLFEFQTQVARLTGMEVANASMYDGSTAMTEAVFMARRITRKNKCIVSAGVHPHYTSVLKTLTRFTGDLVEAGVPSFTKGAPGDDLSSLIASIDADTQLRCRAEPQSVRTHIADLTPLADACHKAGALLIVVVTEIVSLGAIKSPGRNGRRYRGRRRPDRSVPGCCSAGRTWACSPAAKSMCARPRAGCAAKPWTPAASVVFVLTLSTREQHIRREKATSNICTNSGLIALAFSAHLSLLGEKGLRHLAALNHARAAQLADRLGRVPGVTLLNGPFFKRIHAGSRSGSPPCRAQARRKGRARRCVAGPVVAGRKGAGQRHDRGGDRNRDRRGF